MPATGKNELGAAAGWEAITPWWPSLPLHLLCEHGSTTSCDLSRRGHRRGYGRPTGLPSSITDGVCLGRRPRNPLQKPTPSLKKGVSPAKFNSFPRVRRFAISHFPPRLTPDLRSSRLCCGKERAPTEAAQWTPTRVLLSMRSFSKTSSENSMAPCACAHVHSVHAARPSGWNTQRNTA